MSKASRFLLEIFPLLIVGIFFVCFQIYALNNQVNPTIRVRVCGNFIAEAGEECDTNDFAGKTCATYGHNTGVLTCNPDCTVNATACSTTVVPPSPGGGGGGGGGGAPAPTVTRINFLGRAYPLSKVVLLKDGQLAIETISGPDAVFSLSLTGLSAGNYNFAVYSEDADHRRSALFTFPVYITSGAATTVSGIFLSPTIAIDKIEVKYGDDLTIFGQSLPTATVTINVNSNPSILKQTQTDANGVYLYKFDTTQVEKGDHSVRSKTVAAADISPYGLSLAFKVGEKNTLSNGEINPPASGRGDVNNDERINLVDFSIVAYWYKRTKPPAAADLNSDGKVDLIDFSILAYYWTG
ncbi:MAG: hypothetical protein C3F02_01485 [Parcubacteria group bacterium]|nr:MAG: hypothetical protein C3F02_01485 [Parcubacteria group bacterium]